jgi:hypothetical protein
LAVARIAHLITAPLFAITVIELPLASRTSYDH